MVDTTNQRVVVQDGTTEGGWPADLANRTAVSDAAYIALITDRQIAYTALTAARAVSLPAAASYPTGTRLVVVDESGSCSATLTITVNRAGSDTINGTTSAVIASAYGFVALESNGSNKWTIVDQATSNLPGVGIGTAIDPNNALSVYGVSALFNSGSNFNVTVNKAATADTASFIFEDDFSGRAQIGLCGDDNFHFKVSPNGSTWNNGITIDATTGAITPGNARTAVSDAAYTALTTDRLIAYTAITAARAVSLPAAASYPAGVTLTVVDESGSCSATNAITLNTAGTDKIDGGSSAIISQAYGYIALESNGSNAWTVLSTLNPVNGGTTTITFGAFPGASDTSITVADTGIKSSSLVQAEILVAATSDHSADEHWVEEIDISAGNIVAGTGFTIYARARQGGPALYGAWNVSWTRR